MRPNETEISHGRVSWQTVLLTGGGVGKDRPLDIFLARLCRRIPCRLLRLPKSIGLRSHIRLSAVLVKMSSIKLTFIRRFKYALENTNFTLWHSDLFRCQLFHNNVCR